MKLHINPAYLQSGPCPTPHPNFNHCDNFMLINPKIIHVINK